MELHTEALPEIKAPMTDMEWGILVGIGIVIVAT